MKILFRLLGLVVLLGLIVGLLMWRKPLWLAEQVTHFGLFTARVQSNYVMTPEGRVHYYEAEPRIPGGGVPLVLIHGLADRGESWAPMLKRLKRAGFHVYAPDLLGYGRSPKPADSDYSIATEEQFVVDFINALGLQKPNVGGWSMGGMITLHVALDHPDLVNRIVIYDAAGLREGQTVHPVTLFHPQDSQDVQNLFHLMEPEGGPLPHNVANAVVERMGENHNVIDKQMAAISSAQYALDDSIGKLTQPLLIVWGKTDLLTPLALGENFHKLVPASELDIVEGCGHLAPARCSQRVAAATADFLKANPVPMGQIRTLATMGH